MGKVSNCNFTYLRRSPEFDSSVIGVVAANVMVKILDSVGEFYEVEVDALHKGFILKNFVLCEGGM